MSVRMIRIQAGKQKETPASWGSPVEWLVADQIKIKANQGQ
jgi:hypothetical protein